MIKTAKIEVKEGDILASIKEMLKKVLKTDKISAMLVPQHLPMKQAIMPVLVTDHEQLNSADPLAPAFPLNSARLVSRLTRKSAGGEIAAVMRPCEIRAFTELVKLNQGKTDDLLIIGIDCFGAYSNKDYYRFAENIVSTGYSVFYQNILSNKDGSVGNTLQNGVELASACKSCEHPVPYGADILIGLFGVDIQGKILVQGLTPKGESMINLIKLPDWTEPAERKTAVTNFIGIHKEYQTKMFEKTTHATNTFEKLTNYLATCVNCYNCRVACPVCYCKECVFVTDVFQHEPAQYIQWAERRGALKMPTDTLFYHLTRLAHMSTACVGCGQCSNACPNDIPVMELFKTIANSTQKAFDYEAGRSFDEQPPLSRFREDEFTEVVGIN